MLSRHRCKNHFRIIFMASLPAAILLGVLWLHRPLHYHFDARTADVPREFGWTESGDRIGPTRNELMTGLGRRKRVVTVAMPGNLQDYVSDQVGSVVLYSPGGKIDYCLVQSVPMTIESAITEAKMWSERWGGKFSEEAVAKFYREEQAHEEHVWSPVRLDPKKTPKHQIGFEIWPIFVGEKSCYISMCIYWLRDEDKR